MGVAHIREWVCSMRPRLKKFKYWFSLEDTTGRFTVVWLEKNGAGRGTIGGDDKMKKIPTLFKYVDGKCSREPRQDLLDMLTNPNYKVVPTLKFDGTAILYSNGEWYGRYCRREGKDLPENFIPCTYVSETKKTFGWVPTSSTLFGYKAALEEAIGNRGWPEASYELVGPKINNNPHGLDHHQLVIHGGFTLWDEVFGPAALSKHRNDLASYLKSQFSLIEEGEGIVYWLNDEPFCKIRHKDFLKME